MEVARDARVSIIVPRRHTVASMLAPKGACGLATERSVGDPITKVSCSRASKGILWMLESEGILVGGLRVQND